MQKQALALFALGLVLVSLLLACTAPAADTEVEAEGEQAVALLEDRCTGCHGLERTTSSVKSQAEWEDTVDRMVEKGANLSEEEQAILISYLSTEYGP
jgi:hypothetical protein